jgi:acetyl-CoA carboxylase biotin carboxyl carrier protein
MDLKKIKILIELLESSQLSVLEIQEGDITIKLGRESNYSNKIQYDTGRIKATPTLEPLHKEPDQIKNPALIDSNHYVRSPMVGIFYRATAPEKPPLVSLGDHVKLGDPLCIIEAMKILNFIQADKSGCIKSILVSNADPVEFEQPLFVIE